MENRYFNHLSVATMAGLMCACSGDVGPWAGVALGDYTIALARNECNGTCPSYKVEIKGTGEVTFTGKEYVNFVGTTTYRIPQSDVASLVRDIKRLKILQMKDDYGGPVDSAMTAILIDGGPNWKGVLEGVGLRGNEVPDGVFDFQDRIDAVGRTAQFQMTAREKANAEMVRSDFEIKLERTECYGTCPVYSVSVDEDGVVTFIGKKHVSFTGRKIYSIPKEDAAALARDFIAMRDAGLKRAYRGNVFDVATYSASFSSENYNQTIIDYAGYDDAMPPSVTKLQNRIDEVTRSTQFLRGATFERPAGHRQPMDVIVDK
jgi:hypothetical protein